MTRGQEFVRGWRVLLGATLGVSVGIAALPFYTAGVFVKPLEAEFGWTREQLALASLISTFTGAVAAPWIGAIVDRFGVRIPGVIGLLFVSLGFFALSRMPGGFGIFIGIQLGMAVLGAASSPLTFTRVVNAWFDRSKGFALGLALAGIGVTASVAPAQISRLVVEDGWRTGYLALSLVALVVAPVVFFLLGPRADRPPVQAGAPQAALPGPTFPSAIRQPIFWRLLIVFGLLALAVAGWILHFIPMLVESGMTPTEAAAIQGALGLAVLSGRLVTGFLVDYFFAPRVATIALALAAGGVALLAFGGAQFALIAAISLGFALGAEVDLIGYLTARYFGLRAYGRLYGLQYGAFITGAATSPLLIATLAARFGGYPTALAVSVGLLALVSVIFITAPRFPALEGASDA